MTPQQTVRPGKHILGDGKISQEAKINLKKKIKNCSSVKMGKFSYVPGATLLSAMHRRKADRSLVPINLRHSIGIMVEIHPQL